jgi:ubiquilin
MQTGQNVHDPLTQLNSHMGYGLMAGLNPFADMGVNPNDPNMVCCCTLLHFITDV